MSQKWEEEPTQMPQGLRLALTLTGGAETSMRPMAASTGMVRAAEAAMSAVVAVVAVEAKADTPAMVGPPATAETLVGGATSGPEKPQRKPGPMERANIQLQDQLGPYASVNHVVVCSRVRFMS